MGKIDAWHSKLKVAQIDNDTRICLGKKRKIIFTGMCVYTWHELFSDGWQQGDGQKMSSMQLLLCNIFSVITKQDVFINHQS